MEWISQHLWIVVVIAGLAARVLQAAKGKARDAAGKPAAPAKEFEFADPELAERTRKIREEIRRKIEERRGQRGSPPAPAASPVESVPDAPPPLVALPQLVEEVMQSPVERSESPGAAIRFEEERVALAGQVRLDAAMKAAVERRENFEQSIADQGPAALAAGRAALLVDLQSPAALRRAIVLREVLGPPLALR